MRVWYIRFEKIYLNFMSVCFKSFDVSHGFSKTAAFIQNHVVWVNLTLYPRIYDLTLQYTKSMYDLNQFVFEQSKRVNDEE